VPLPISRAPDAEPALPSVHEPSHASTLMPTGPDPVTNVASSTASGRPPLIDLVQFRLRQNQESSSLPSDPIPPSSLFPSFLPMREPKGFRYAAEHHGWIAG
jgi:hypothetical protein